MQSETLAQEFARLVKEYHDGDEHTKPEAWNLLADYAVENASAIAAALSEQERAVEVKGVQEALDGLLETDLFLDNRGERLVGTPLSGVRDAVRSVIAVLRSALVDVPAEPVAWRYRHNGGKWTVQKNKPQWFRDGMRNVELEPLFASPTLSRQGEDSAEVVRKARAMATAILQNFGAMEDGNGEEAPELAMARDLLAATRSGPPTTAKEITRPAVIAVSGGEPSEPSSDAGGAKMDDCSHPGRSDDMSGHINAKSEQATKTLKGGGDHG